MISDSLKHEIENTFHVISARSSADELMFICPECGDQSGNRSVNLKSGKTHCWRCGKGKSGKGLFTAWARSLGYTFSETTSYTGETVEDVFTRAPKATPSIVPLVQEVKLPEGFTPISARPTGVYTRLIVDMARRKNLDYEDFASAGVGYTSDDPYWEAYAIFPVVEYNTPVYYQGRTYVDIPGESTKRFPSRSYVKYGAANWIYGIDDVRDRSPEIVVVVESILNVLSLRRKFAELGWKSLVPVCVFKHHISQVQSIKLLRCKSIKEVCMLFDHDAIEETWKAVGNLSNKTTVTVAEMPMKDGNKKLDPNDDVDAAVEAIEKRKLYTPAAALGKALGFV